MAYQQFDSSEWAGYGWRLQASTAVEVRPTMLLPGDVTACGAPYMQRQPAHFTCSATYKTLTQPPVQQQPVQDACTVLTAAVLACSSS